MDPATIVIAAAAVSGASAVQEITKLAVAGIWSEMKAAIKRKFGADSTAIDVIDEVERLPAGTEPSPMLSNRINELGLANEPDIADALQRMETLLNERVPGAIEKQYNFYGNVFHNTNFN